MVNGFKVTMSGEQLRSLLTERIADLQAQAARWERETRRTIEDQTEDAPLLPEHMCEYEAEELGWRADVLTFLRDHLDISERYRLGQSDLEFADVLPAKPWLVEQRDYEERASVGFGLERIAKRLGEGLELVQVVQPEPAPQ